MHAFLFIGKDQGSINSEIQKKARELKSEMLEFAISGIGEVREVIKFSQLSLKTPTVFLIKDVDQLSPEAVNAFLKALEEPQANLTFFLTASSLYKILPTIISRCQIVKAPENQSLDQEKLHTCLKFLKLDIPARFKEMESLKERGEAITFVQDFLTAVHFLLSEKKSDKKLLLKALQTSQSTLTALELNGNVSLQLTNLAVNL